MSATLVLDTPRATARLRGFTVDLGEVEAALARLPLVQAAAAAVVRDAAGRERLVGYVAGARAPDLAAVRRRLGTRLPHHMVPTAVIACEALPLMPDGAPDRAALAALAPIPAERVTAEADGISPVEETVLNAFRRMLDRPDLGLDDDFFDQGGDSLLAIETAMELERLLGQTTPVALLGHGGTARALARMLEDAPVDTSSRIVTLQAEGEAPALFCVHDVYGRALSPISLARRLAPHQPVHGLLFGGGADARDCASLVARHVATIRAVQPHGPYQLSGFSFCGPIAHAVACALEAEGEAVSLVLIDSPVRLRWPGPLAAARWLARELGDGVRPLLRDLRAHRSTWLRWMLPWLPIRAREIPGFVPRCDHDAARAIMRARIGWRPGRFTGATLLVRGGTQGATGHFMDVDGLLGWRSALGGRVTVLEMDATHNDMMREPHVADIADAIRAEARALG